MQGPWRLCQACCSVNGCSSSSQGAWHAVTAGDSINAATQTCLHSTASPAAYQGDSPCSLQRCCEPESPRHDISVKPAAALSPTSLASPRTQHYTSGCTPLPCRSKAAASCQAVRNRWLIRPWRGCSRAAPSARQSRWHTTRQWHTTWSTQGPSASWSR
jgi:hypothetical protein